MRTYEIRADYDRDTIVVYQAYNPEIGNAALAHGRFVEPFSRNRMTWIKPSFLWMMARCGWARKPGQEMVLAVRISRSGWEEALSLAEHTSADRRIYADSAEWRERSKHARVRVQWDPERTLRGATLDARSIQIGLSRSIIDRYVDEWIVAIDDYTPLVRKMHAHLRDGHIDRAKQLLPSERVYPVAPELALRLGID
ncbi:DUF4291 domain-containing protein [Nocardia sp. NPDC050406]|uniref:DUF4291 domain-containing protein n=1 Tax=Nocardia sp. NPDC050406 TaxID=3364318 RepID=UPI0037BBF523